MPVAVDTLWSEDVFSHFKSFMAIFGEISQSSLFKAICDGEQDVKEGGGTQN